MKLHNELVFPQAYYIGHDTKPTTEEPKITLNFRVALTRDVAESFGCRDLLYAGDVPRGGYSSIPLEGEEKDCAIHVKHEDVAFSAVAGKIWKYVAHLEGDGLVLSFKVGLLGFSEEASALARSVRVNPLELTLKPAQMDLGLQPEKAAAAAAVVGGGDDEDDEDDWDEKEK